MAMLRCAGGELARTLLPGIADWLTLPLLPITCAYKYQRKEGEATETPCIHAVSVVQPNVFW
jgi:hypothetical protein